MKLTSNMKRILSALLVLIMVFSVMPVNAVNAASDAPIDGTVIFTDLHTNKSNYKQSNVTNLFTAIKNAGLPISSVHSGGDAFSVNESSGKYTGYTSTISGYIRSALGNSNLPIHYVWSDHDRYALQEDDRTLLDKSSHLVYGAGNDGIYGTADDGNYYVYMLSMGDLSTNDRYSAGFSSNRAANGFTATVDQAIANFRADTAKLHKDRPLLIVSHQPLLDNRNDNGYAYQWCTAINEVASEMDVAFFFGHNHRYDKASDYYYAKGSTMSVCSDSSGNAKSVKLNFAHICAGYMEPTSTGSYSSSGTRRNVVMAVLIYEDSLQFTTYTNTGVYTGSYALNVTVPRDHASAAPEVPETTAPAVTEPVVTEPVVTEPVVTEPVVTEPEETEPEATEPSVPETPEEPEVAGTIWRKATTIEAGKRYILVNYGYNASGIETFAIGSTAAPVSVTVKTDDKGAYVVTDDLSLAWVAEANGNQFHMANAQTGKYLRAANYVYGNSGSDISVNSSVNSGSTYTSWSLETKNNNQVLAVRRSGSSNYYPVRYTGAKFQAFNSSQVGSMTNWLAVFVETEENAHTHNFETVTVAATCTKEGSVTTSCACGEKSVEVIPALGHKYTCVETAATCAEAGAKVYTCSVCGDTYTEVIPATGKHTYETVTVDATCAEAGSVTSTCSVCGDSYTEVIPATGNHAYETVTVAATCAEAGSVTNTCSVCGDTYTEVIPATGKHNYETTTVAATCTEDGSQTKVCSVCEDTVIIVIPALGHAYKAVVTAPTCEKEGYTTYTCACGDTYVADKVAALGHSYTSETKDATCNQEGEIVYTCACGDSYTEVIPATGKHTYKTTTVAATCTEDGKIVYTCACGESYTEVIPATGKHVYESVVVEPTCEEAGSVTYTCECGNTYTEEIPAAGHTYKAVVTAPTCEKEGYTTYTCACGETYVADEVAALGHTYKAVVTAPTCEEEGYTTYTCACGETYVADKVAALGHTYKAVVTAPTCEKEGYTTYTCACGDSYVADKVAALGHDYKAVVTAPTCEKEGYTTYTCACGDSYVADKVAALGHSYTAEEVDGYMVYTCACGHSYSEKLTVELEYVKASSLSENKYVITLVSNSKYYALSHKNNTVSAVRVTVSNGVITSEVTEDLVWEYSNKKLCYESDGTTYYLHAQSSYSWWGWASTPTLTISSRNSTEVSFSSNKLKMGSYYLRYSNSRISLNRSASTANLFMETEK